MLRRNDLVDPELSYKIIGVLFCVFNKLGPGHKEKYYQRAAALAFHEAGLSYQEQFSVPLFFENKNTGRYYFDFLIESKIIVELKSGDKFSRYNIQQTVNYLKSRNLQLGIIANFTRHGLKFRRILNITPET